MNEQLERRIHDPIVKAAWETIIRANSRTGLLSKKDLGLLFGFNPNGSVMRMMLTDPAFPRAIYIGVREPRWKSDDVLRYIDNMHEKQTL